MKKMISLIVALMVCLMLAAPALAAEDTFVPSISEKESPDVEDAVMGDEDVDPCLIVTSIMQAINKSTDIHQESRDLLLQVYEQLKNDMMKLDVADGYVVRELVDVSFAKTDCVEDADHLHEEELMKPDVTVDITFDLGVKSVTNVVVLNYYEGTWHNIPTKNNGDGTVTCTFDHFSPVAFCVGEDEAFNPPATGDEFGAEVLLWGGLMAGSVAMLVALLLFRRKNAQA